jgi:hypothetical protein
MITLHPHNRRIGYRKKYRNSWKDLRDFTSTELRRKRQTAALAKTYEKETSK